MTDWREQLRDFLDRNETQDYSWSKRDLDQEPDVGDIVRFLKDLGFEDIHYDV